MIGFWIGAAAMLVVCVAALLPSLWGKRRLTMAQRSEHTVQAAKTRLTELESDLAKQDITQAQFDLARADLETALSDELRLADKDDVSNVVQSTKPLPALWLTAIPVVAVAVYMAVGQPNAIQLAQETATPEQNAANAIAALERRLLDNPDDTEGWSMLGRSFMAVRQYDEAARAFSRLNQLAPDNLDVTAQYAGALALSVGSFTGKPQALLDEVLIEAPDHPQGLWLAAMAARTQGDVETAIRNWTRLLNAPGTDETMRVQIQALLAQATEELNDSQSEDAPFVTEPVDAEISLAASLAVSVTIDEALIKNASPDDTLFIFARAVDGPPMPLAAAKQTVSDLPVTITLDDSMAMTPAMKLSSFDNVQVVARVSKSGTPTKQSGDLEGVSESIKLPLKETVNVRIDRVLP